MKVLLNGWTPNKRIRKWRSHRSSNWKKVEIAVGSPSLDELGRDSLGNKNERDNSEAERHGDESKRRPEEERSKETRGTSSGGTRSILREDSKEVMDGTSVMVEPSISRTYTFIIYYSCRCGYSSSGALFLSLSRIGGSKGQWRSNVSGIRYTRVAMRKLHFLRRSDDAGGDLSRVIRCDRTIPEK